MKKLLPALLLAFSLSCGAQSLQGPDKSAAFDLTQITVNQVISLLYSEALLTNYVIDPEVLTDSRLVSFRYRGTQPALKPFVISFFNTLGYSIETKNGVDYIHKTRVADKPLDEEVTVYRTKYRDTGYVVRILSPLFKGRFTQQKSVQTLPGQGVAKDVSPTSAAGAIDQESDVLIFSGSAKENAQLAKLLPQIDVAKGEVAVRAVVYEVSSSKLDGSAFKLLANLLDSKLGISINTDATALGNSISLKVGGLDAVIGALSTDNRFKAVTQPRLRVRSGDTSRLVVGQDVPVLGSVTFQQGGAAVRSVDYRSAGTILQLTPTVRDDVIDMRVEQQLSNFVRTDTGVNDSPTLIKRELSTSISSKSGDVIVLGGLSETKTTNTRRGLSFLPWATSKQDEDSTVDVLVILQVEKI